MINNINLKNFKGFKNLEGIDLKPITILCGTNSCGKSSIIQSILALKQSMENKIQKIPLKLNGRYVKLGNFNNVVYQQKKESMLLGFKYKLERNRANQSSLRLIINNFKSFKDNFDYEIKNEIEFNNENNNTFIKKYKALLLKNGNEISSIELKKIKKNKYQITPTNIKNNFVRNKNKTLNTEFTATVIFEGLMPKIIEINSKNFGIEKIISIQEFFSLFSNSIKEEMDLINYIGPLRKEPARKYIYEEDNIMIGNKGENAPFIYALENDRDIKNYFHFDIINQQFKMVHSKKISEIIKEWFEIMNINGFSHKFDSGVISLNFNSNNSKETFVSIADVGFGISQIFPILLEGIRMKKNSTLILEQPEIHLHPKLEMNLADFFISLALSNKKLLVETHSENIINRLVRRVLENPELKNMIGIYFLDNEKEGIDIKKVEVNPETGTLNWPQGFFDQNANEQSLIIEAILKNRKNGEKNGKKKGFSF